MFGVQHFGHAIDIFDGTGGFDAAAGNGGGTGRRSATDGVHSLSHCGHVSGVPGWASSRRRETVQNGQDV